MQRPLGLAVFLSLGVAGCATGPDYKAPLSADLGVPASYAGRQAAPLAEAELANWWTRFGDPALNALVEQAVAANLDIAQAEARLRQAREASVQAGAGLLPSLGASAGGGRNFNSSSGDNNSFSLGLDASWQADLFGGTRRGVEAARADEAASRYSLASVRVAIVAEVVTNYIQLRLAQEQLRIAGANVGHQRENRNIAGWRVQAGLVSSLDEQQARVQLAQTEASIPAIEGNLAGALNRLAVLTGQAPGAATQALEAPAPIPEPPAGISAGIPADTLRQRPDVLGAERSLAAATARIGVAEAQLLPSLGISGNIGTSALRPGGLFDIVTGALFASLGQTIFDGGARRSQMRSQQAAVDGAFASYRQTVLGALEDVENALVAGQAAERRTGQFAEAADAANNSALLARLQYQSGLTDFQTLLTAEQSLLSASNSLAGSRAEEALAVVQLYNALGGGWQTMDGSGR
ncbi:efflux transporter outer membrane subunit [Sandaracinobacter sp. RS1-74]|uniref:efflux transporter outer membrane subunit n=1 Tax=Sandaracinobacteroides sayramensis TaxID=2913411 RepID=UPI001EDB40F0|nr:efflux transporter outer membrane subunit [Sandaracinobacteroides sayramensis]MCG2841527.1 efflux transporter outer membrane subunit [Sandaracinobacteroides sayramensis]